MSNYENRKASLQTLWIKGTDGNTYLCRASDIKDRNNVTDEELRSCIVESENPQNE